MSEQQTLADLYWLLGCVTITIGVVEQDGGASTYLTIDDLDDKPTFYGPLSSCLGQARSYCEQNDITP